MPKNKRAPLATVRPLKDQLNGKSHRRRTALADLAAAPLPRALRNDPLPRLDLVELPLADLRKGARNVRICHPAHVREVAGSIGTLGFCVPVLIGKDNVIIDGQVRAEAARTLGLERVPCIRIDHLTNVEQRVLRLAVNRHGENGQWNLDVLKLEFEELILADAPIDITGFAPDEVDHVILGEGVDEVETGILEPDRGAVAVTRIGDLFQLGPHRVVCGSATDRDVFHRLMDGDGLARLVLTDEPYNVPIAGNVSQGAHREFAMASGEMTDAEFYAFNMAWMEIAASSLCEGGVFGTFIDWRGLPIVSAAATTLGLTALNLIVWAKTNAGMGSLYRSQHELLPLFKKGDAPHVNNVSLGRKGRWRSNLWTYPGASSLGSDARRGLKHHPTVKPVALLEDALLDLTERGDIVLDPFLGSGSTLVAADRTGRLCRGIELDPLYVDVIIHRYRAATGKPAVLIETDETFEDLATSRACNPDAAPQDGA